jgi:hypothetical protein
MKCRRDGCGKYVKVAHFSTKTNDPDNKHLQYLMMGLAEIAYCRFHQNQRTHYASQGRLEDWEAGRP